MFHHSVETLRAYKSSGSSGLVKYADCLNCKCRSESLRKCHVLPLPNHADGQDLMWNDGFSCSRQTLGSALLNRSPYCFGSPHGQQVFDFGRDGLLQFAMTSLPYQVHRDVQRPRE